MRSVYRLLVYRNLLKTNIEVPSIPNNNLFPQRLCSVRLSQVENFESNSTKKRNLFRLGLAVGIGMVFGGGYELLQKKNLVYDRNTKYDETDNIKKKVNFPEKINPTRKVDGPLTDLGLTLTLYQFQSCPFCCKVRAFLEFYGIPFNVVEVHPVLKKELVFSDNKKVPLLLIGHGKEHEVLNESSLIVTMLGTFLLHPERGLEHALQYFQPVKYTNEEGKEITETTNMYFLMFGEDYEKQPAKAELDNERKWRRWVDTDLVHLISPNVYRTLDESVETFEKFSERGQWHIVFKNWERNLAIYAGAAVMYLIGKRLKKKHNLKKDVRESLYEASRRWTAAVGKRKFLGGDYPNLGDLAVYGVLNSMEGCRAFEDMVKETEIGPWYKSVQKHITNHTGSQLVAKKRSISV